MEVPGSGCQDLDLLPHLSAPLSVLKFCIAGLILLANILLVTVILRSQGLRQQRYNKFILSLACADLLVALVMPFMALTATERAWTLGPAFCQVSLSLTKFDSTFSKSR